MKTSQQDYDQTYYFAADDMEFQLPSFKYREEICFLFKERILLNHLISLGMSKIGNNLGE